MKKNLIVLFLGLAGTGFGQTNTAVTSGSIGKCAVWSYPYTLYNSSGASQTVNNGVTVTVDQNRNIGAVNLTGTGAMDMSGTNGITLSGSGSEINCRWDIGGGGSYAITNNDGMNTTANPRNIGTFFTAPYTGDYFWVKGAGWSASLSGSYLNGSVTLRKDATGSEATVFYQNQAGSCGLLGGSDTPAFWNNSFGLIPLSAGNTMSYMIGTGYTSSPACANSRLDVTKGSAYMVFEN